MHPHRPLRRLSIGESCPLIQVRPRRFGYLFRGAERCIRRAGEPADHGHDPTHGGLAVHLGVHDDGAGVAGLVGSAHGAGDFSAGVDGNAPVCADSVVSV